ncbi:MAG: nitroreductase family protein [Bilophila sp.]
MLTLDSGACVRCGSCVLVCPVGLFVRSAGEVIHYFSGKSEQCIHCGHCYAVCQVQAITLDGVRDLSAMETLRLDAQQRDMLFRGRRSVRIFRKEPVPESVLCEALRDASYAPTGGNAQNVEWILVNESERIRAIVSQTAAWLRREANPRYARYVEAYDAGHDAILRDAPQAVFAHTPADWKWGAQDATGAITYLDLSLHTRGVGTCWTGLVIAAANANAVPALRVPEGRHVYGGLMVGYPAVPFVRIPPRKDVRVQ